MHPRAYSKVNLDVPPVNQCLGEPCVEGGGACFLPPGEYSVHPLEGWMARS